MNTYFAIYEMAVFLNRNCSSTTKQIRDERS